MYIAKKFYIEKIQITYGFKYSSCLVDLTFIVHSSNFYSIISIPSYHFSWSE